MVNRYYEGRRHSPSPKRPTEDRCRNSPKQKAKNLYAQELLSVRNKTKSRSASSASSSGHMSPVTVSKSKATELLSRNRSSSSGESAESHPPPRRKYSRDKSSSASPKYRRPVRRPEYEKRRSESHSSRHSSEDERRKPETNRWYRRETDREPRRERNSRFEQNRERNARRDVSREKDVRRGVNREGETRHEKRGDQLGVGGERGRGDKSRFEELVDAKRESPRKGESPVSRGAGGGRGRGEGSREAKLQVLCTLGLVKENERLCLPDSFIDEVWDKVCRARKEKISAGKELELEERVKMAVEGRVTSLYGRRDQTEATRDREREKGEETRGSRVFSAALESSRKREQQQQSEEEGDAVYGQEERRRSFEAVKRREKQIAMLSEELEKIEKEIERQFSRRGRDRDRDREEEGEGVLDEQMKLGRKLKQQISQMEHEKNLYKNTLLHRYKGSGAVAELDGNGDAFGVDTKVGGEGDAQLDYYDGGEHYCRMCDLSCNTVIHFLTHLHSSTHRQIASHYGERPWAKLRKEVDVSVKTALQPAPICGSEFIIPTLGFFCKLCCEFSGDVADCEMHVTSELHNAKYRDHVKRNTSYEKRMKLQRAARPSNCTTSPNVELRDQKSNDFVSQSEALNLKPEPKELYEDAFGLNRIEASNVAELERSQRKKNYAGEVAGKPNFTVTINRSDEEGEVTASSQPSQPKDSVSSDEEESEDEKSRNLKQQPPKSYNSRGRSYNSRSPSPRSPYRPNDRYRKKSTSPRRPRKYSSSMERKRRRNNRSPPSYRRSRRSRSRDYSPRGRGRQQGSRFYSRRGKRSRSISEKKLQSPSSDRKRRESPMAKRKRSESSRSNVSLGSETKRVKPERQGFVTAELKEEKRDVADTPQVSSFSLKKISLPLTGNDQYFTESADSGKPAQGHDPGVVDMEESPDENEANEKEEKKEVSGISFSISQQDKLKKQILETKIFSQMQKTKAIKNNGSDGAKLKCMTGKRLGGTANRNQQQQQPALALGMAQAHPVSGYPLYHPGHYFPSMAAPLQQYPDQNQASYDPPPPGME